MTRNKTGGVVLASVWVVLAASAPAAMSIPGCSDGDDRSTAAVCRPTCPKQCNRDEDCDTAAGRVCCDFGADGKACLPATECPRFCNADDRCRTEEGEACVRVTLDSDSKVCTDPAAAVNVCSSDADCDTDAGETCCDIYREPVCIPAARCPSPCSTADDCDGAAGEICCTTLAREDRRLRDIGLCIDPDSVACPRTCDSSSDCDGASGELCCEGVCRTRCERTCNDSSDCDGMVCCKTRAVRSVWFSGSPPLGFQPTATCSFDDECDDGERCTDLDVCQLTCESAMQCVSRECEAGCDPNAVCNTRSCPQAFDIAQCIADNCPSCFTQGFFSTACGDCDLSACSDLPCSFDGC